MRRLAEVLEGGRQIPLQRVVVEVIGERLRLSKVCGVGVGDLLAMAPVSAHGCLTKNIPTRPLIRKAIRRNGKPIGWRGGVVIR